MNFRIGSYYEKKFLHSFPSILKKIKQAIKIPIGSHLRS
jgi:hypothetical protein